MPFIVNSKLPSFKSKEKYYDKSETYRPSSAISENGGGRVVYTENTGSS